MTSSQISHVLVVLCATLAFSCASALPRDILFTTANGDLVDDSEPIVYPPYMQDQALRISEQEDKPKGCFHFYVSRNMSSLLAEATKMLRTIRDRREREWILTFIYRIKSLAEHLRAHPDSRNYDCLPNDEEGKKRILSDNAKGQQPELYFVDDVPKRSGEGEEPPEKPAEKNTDDNREPKPEVDQPEADVPPMQESDPKPPASKFQTESSAETASDSTLTESDDQPKDATLPKQDLTTSVQDQEFDERNMPPNWERPDPNSIIISSPIDCSPLPKCHTLQNAPPLPSPQDNYFADAGNIYPMYQSIDASDQEFEKEELYRREILKQRIRKALLEELAPEIKKLRTVGGTEIDLMNVWNSNFVQELKAPEEHEETDFDYEETGAAAGDPNLNESVQPDRTVAPSLDEVQNSKENSNSKDSSYEPYDDSDDLVHQLFDARFNNPPPKTTKSLSDQNDEYLITSTQIPF